MKKESMHGRKLGVKVLPCFLINVWSPALLACIVVILFTGTHYAQQSSQFSLFHIEEDSKSTLFTWFYSILTLILREILSACHACLGM